MTYADRFTGTLQTRLGYRFLVHRRSPDMVIAMHTEGSVLSGPIPPGQAERPVLDIEIKEWVGRSTAILRGSLPHLALALRLRSYALFYDLYPPPPERF